MTVLLFFLTLCLFAACLVAVFVAERAQLAQSRRRAQQEEHHLAPPSGRPLPVPGDAPRSRER